MKTPRVLIVDDEPNIRLMLRTALASEGYALAEAANGREALDLVDREPPDVMLLDLSMPVLDGMAVLRGLRGEGALASRAEVRPIVLTAYGSIAAAVRATRLGAIDFLEKPVTPTEVRDAVKAALAEPLEPSLRMTPADVDALSGGYDAVIARVRVAVRASKLADAETLLMKASDLAHGDAAYFNLLGVLYEIQKKWRLAKKFYGKALSADKRYLPAQNNLRRIYELYTFGASREPVALGDEPDSVLAQMLQGAH